MIPLHSAMMSYSACRPFTAELKVYIHIIIQMKVERNIKLKLTTFDRNTGASCRAGQASTAATTSLVVQCTAATSLVVQCTAATSLVVQCTAATSLVVHCTAATSLVVQCTAITSLVVQCTATTSLVVQCTATTSLIVQCTATTSLVVQCTATVLSIIIMLMRDEEGRKKQARSYKQQGKATQHTQGSHFFKKKELPLVGLELTTLHTLNRAFYQL